MADLTCPLCKSRLERTWLRVFRPPNWWAFADVVVCTACEFAEEVIDILGRKEAPAS